MRALQLDASRQLGFADLPEPTPAASQVLLHVRAASLNHRELWISKGMYPGMQLPATLGADGAGVVAAVGDGVDPAWVGREVICYPALGWGDDLAAPGPEFRLYGMPEPGFIAEQISVPAENLVAKPSHLTWVEAAALPVASLTAWRAVTRHANVQPGQKVLITGIGGGVAQAALSFVTALGAQAYVTSSSDDKIGQAIGRGAVSGVNYTQEGWEQTLRKLSGGIDAVIDGAPPKDFGGYLRFLRTGAKVVIYGIARNESTTFSCSHLFLRHIAIVGTSMGTPEEFGQMIRFIEEKGLRPVVSEVFPFGRAVEAIEALADGSHAGKIVVDLSRP